MKKLPKSLRKYIRKEKARIKRDILSKQERSEFIDNLYKKFGFAYLENKKRAA